MKAQKIAIAALASMLVALGAALGAQSQLRTVPPQTPVEPVTPTVLSDGNIGFRVLGMRGQTPVGEWLVRVNGEWVHPELGGDPHFQMR